MKIRHIAFLIVASWPLSLAAKGYQPLEQLALAAQETVAAHYETHYSREDMEVIVNPADSRLKLALCDKELTLAMQRTPQLGGNLAVQVSCDGSSRWSIYLTATVNIWGDVLVASNSLARAHRIQADDLTLQRTNLAQNRSGTITHLEEALGMELKRSIKAGQALRVQDLIEPKVIRRGDSVQVAAYSGGLKVITPGTALSDGRVGQQIAIENSRSMRKIRAKVIAEGLVEVPL